MIIDGGFAKSAPGDQAKRQEIPDRDPNAGQGHKMTGSEINAEAAVAALRISWDGERDRDENRHPRTAASRRLVRSRAQTEFEVVRAR